MIKKTRKEFDECYNMTNGNWILSFPSFKN